jgi:hypothetical protein
MKAQIVKMAENTFFSIISVNRLVQFLQPWFENLNDRFDYRYPPP